MSKMNYMKNSGISETIIQEDNKTHKNLLQWNADYDGDKDKGNVVWNINHDGRDASFKTSFTKEDLAYVLNSRPHQKPLEERIREDFRPTVELKKCAPTQYVRPALIDYKFVEDEEPIPMEMDDLREYSLQELTPAPYLRPTDEIVLRNTRKNRHVKLPQKHKTKGRHHKTRNIYKTPSPQNLRIHFTSPSTSSSYTRKHGGKRRNRIKRKKMKK